MVAFHLRPFGIIRFRGATKNAWRIDPFALPRCRTAKEKSPPLPGGGRSGLDLWTRRGRRCTASSIGIASGRSRWPTTGSYRTPLILQCTISYRTCENEPNPLGKPLKILGKGRAQESDLPVDQDALIAETVRCSPKRHGRHLALRCAPDPAPISGRDQFFFQGLFVSFVRRRRNHKKRDRPGLTLHHYRRGWRFLPSGCSATL